MDYLKTIEKLTIKIALLIHPKTISPKWINEVLNVENINVIVNANSFDLGYMINNIKIQANPEFVEIFINKNEISTESIIELTNISFKIANALTSYTFRGIGFNIEKKFDKSSVYYSFFDKKIEGLNDFKFTNYTFRNEKSKDYNINFISTRSTTDESLRVILNYHYSQLPQTDENLFITHIEDSKKYI